MCGVIVIFMFFYCMVWKLEREKVYLAIVSSVIVDECKRKKFEGKLNRSIYIYIYTHNYSSIFVLYMYLSLWNEMGHAI